jgi:hypothetical protein
MRSSGHLELANGKVGPFPFTPGEEPNGNRSAHKTSQQGETAVTEVDKISLIRRAVKLGLHVGEHSHCGIKLSIARPGVRPLQPIHLF